MQARQAGIRLRHGLPSRTAAADPRRKQIIFKAVALLAGKRSAFVFQITQYAVTVEITRDGVQCGLRHADERVPSERRTAVGEIRDPGLLQVLLQGRDVAVLIAHRDCDLAPGTALLAGKAQDLRYRGAALRPRVPAGKDRHVLRRLRKGLPGKTHQVPFQEGQVARLRCRRRSILGIGRPLDELTGLLRAAFDALDRRGAHAEELLATGMASALRLGLRQRKYKKALPAPADEFRDDPVLHRGKAGKAVKIKICPAGEVRAGKQAHEPRQGLLCRHGPAAEPRLEGGIDRRQILQLRRKKRRDALAVRDLAETLGGDVVHVPFREEASQLRKKARPRDLLSVNGKVLLPVLRREGEQQALSVLAQKLRPVRGEFAENALRKMPEADDLDVQHGLPRVGGNEGLLRREGRLFGYDHDMAGRRILKALPDHERPER